MNVKFLFDDIDMDEVSGFELGDIIITREGLQCTSLNRTPNQSMMLFITIPNLLKQIRKMVENRQKETVIMGVDSSYSLKIKKEKGSYVISDDKCFISGIEQKELLDAVYLETKNIWDKYSEYIISDSVRNDFNDALEYYTEFLTMIQK